MAKWARIHNNKCVEIITFEPMGNFNPDLKWVKVPVHLEKVVDTSFDMSPDGNSVTTTTENLKAVVKKLVAAERYVHEIKGVTITRVAGEQCSVSTDRESQNKILATQFGLLNGMATEISFKTMSGSFILFTKESFALVANGVFKYVQECFAAEGLHATNIDALTDDIAIATYDFSKEWPSNLV